MVTATIHFSVTIEGESFEQLQKRVRGFLAMLKEIGIEYSINSEGAA